MTAATVRHPIALALLLVLATTLAAPAGAGLGDMPAGRYVEDPKHAYIMFNYEHLGFSNPYVRFRDFDIAMDLDPARPERSRIEVTIPVASVDSGVDEFDDHLRGENWFNATAHPEARFVSTGINLDSDDTGTLTGDLTIMGQTHPVTLNVRLNKAGQHPFTGKPWFGISASGLIKRSTWGLGRYAPNVTDEVQLVLEVEMQKAD